MPLITNSNDIEVILREFIRVLEKKFKLSIPKQDKDNIVAILKPALQNAGGLNQNDPQIVNKLKQGIITCLTTLKTSPELNKGPIREVLSLNFKNEKNLTPQQKLKLNIGMAYIKALEKNPDLKLNMPLLFKFADKPNSLTPAERKELAKDLEAVGKLIENDPALRDLSREVNAVKNEVTKNPDEKLDDNLTTQLAQNMQMLFGGGNPQAPLASNANGVLVNSPITSIYRPIDSLEDAVKKDIQNATTGAEAEIFEEGNDVMTYADTQKMEKLDNHDMEGFIEQVQRSPAPDLQKDAAPAPAPQQFAEQDEPTKNYSVMSSNSKEASPAEENNKLDADDPEQESSMTSRLKNPFLKSNKPY